MTCLEFSIFFINGFGNVIGHDMQLVGYGMFECTPIWNRFSYPHIIDAVQWGSVEIRNEI